MCMVRMRTIMKVAFVLLFLLCLILLKTQTQWLHDNSEQSYNDVNVPLLIDTTRLLRVTNIRTSSSHGTLTFIRNRRDSYFVVRWISDTHVVGVDFLQPDNHQPEDDSISSSHYATTITGDYVLPPHAGVYRLSIVSMLFNQSCATLDFDRRIPPTDRCGTDLAMRQELQKTFTISYNGDDRVPLQATTIYWSFAPTHFASRYEVSDHIGASWVFRRSHKLLLPHERPHHHFMDGRIMNETCVVNECLSRDNVICLVGDSHYFSLWKAMISILGNSTTTIVFHRANYPAILSRWEPHQLRSCRWIFVGLGQWTISNAHNACKVNSTTSAMQFAQDMKVAISRFSVMYPNANVIVTLVEPCPGDWINRHDELRDFRVIPVLNAWNGILTTVMSEIGIPVLDFFSLLLPVVELTSGECHYGGMMLAPAVQLVFDNVCPECTLYL